MSQNEPSTTLNQDASSTDLLRSLLERLGVSARGNLFRALEPMSDVTKDLDESQGAEEVSFGAAREQMKTDLMIEVRRLSTCEAFIFRRWAEGATIREIASEMNEDMATVSRHLKNAQQSVLHGLSKQRDHQLRTEVTDRASRLEALAELQQRLCLTSTKAVEWHNVIHEARR